jgi:hypothetical protein
MSEPKRTDRFILHAWNLRHIKSISDRREVPISRHRRNSEVSAAIPLNRLAFSAVDKPTRDN